MHFERSMHNRCTTIAQTLLQSYKLKFIQYDNRCDRNDDLIFAPASLSQITVPLLRSGKKGLRKDTLCDVRARDCHSYLASGKMRVCPLRV